MVFIKHKYDDSLSAESTKEIPFRDIAECYVVNQHPAKESPKHFSYEFFLKTIDRVFQLYTPSKQER